MNFLFLNWKDVRNPEVGGAEIIAFEFARRLVKDGHSVTFFSRGFKSASQEENIDGVRVVRRGGKLSVYFHAYLFWLREGSKIDKVIDMINTICWMTPLYVPAEKRIAYLNQLAREVLFYELPWPISFLSYYLEKIEYIPYRKNTKFLCYSKSSKEDLVSFGVKNKNVSIFPMGLDHDRYFPHGKKSEYPLFIFVARLVSMKRPDLCIKATSEVAKKYPNVRLAIIGNGQIEEKLQDMVEKLKLDKNVSFVNKNNFHIDKKASDPKVKLMREAWALLLPSVKEGWGMVVTEAAACGTPSIVTNVTGLKDSVLDGKTGIVINSNPEVKDLTSAMIEIIENKKRRKKMSEEGIKWGNNFSWDKSYEGFKKLLFAR